MTSCQVGRPEAKRPIVHNGMVTVRENREVKHDGVDPRAQGIVSCEVDPPGPMADVIPCPAWVVCSNDEDGIWKKRMRQSVKWRLDLLRV